MTIQQADPSPATLRSVDARDEEEAEEVGVEILL